jgi:D-alanyl-lipoteichoic acid acyltransferase DltB (MBOAT superfamily)
VYFTSYEFILFIAICFILYYVIPRRLQWVLLLAASFLFYYWSGPAYPLFLVAVGALTYTGARLVERKQTSSDAWLLVHRAELSKEERKQWKKKTARAKRMYMLAGLLACLVILGVFKYTNFFIGNVNALLAAAGSGRRFDTVQLLLPMGLSFYTFQSLGYLLDVYMGKVKAERNFFKYLLFVSFFPQLIQGPISRYSQVAESMYAEHPFEWKRVRFGLERMLWGFFKKLVVADTISPAVVCIMGDADSYTGAWVLVGIFFYAAQLYADFSGGIDITIGIAEVFGITLPENFIRPYLSKNIAEFWRRWHITMGTWFRDYIFYPMSVAPSMMRLTQKCKARFGKGAARRVPIYLATMVTWFATGIWHGASWNFIVWGLLNGVVILASEELKPLYDRFHARFPRLVRTKGYGAFQIVRTFLLMGCLRMLDCYRNVGITMRMFVSMFTDFKLGALSAEEFLSFGVTKAQYVIVAAGCVIMAAVSICGRKESVREQIAAFPYAAKYAVFAGLFFAVLLFGSYGYGFDAAQFIYNQF